MFQESTEVKTAGSRWAVNNGVRVPLDTIRAPGAYVCDWSGHLLRVPPGSLAAEGLLPVNIVGGAPLTATKISDDADVPIARARSVAWSFGLSVGF
ncbi:MAG: hypothetical protein AB1716_10345 [Planctomycetota bacterium]